MEGTGFSGWDKIVGRAEFNSSKTGIDPAADIASPLSLSIQPRAHDPRKYARVTPLMPANPKRHASAQAPRTARLVCQSHRAGYRKVTVSLPFSLAEPSIRETWKSRSFSTHWPEKRNHPLFGRDDFSSTCKIQNQTIERRYRRRGKCSAGGLNQANWVGGTRLNQITERPRPLIHRWPASSFQ